MWPYRHLQSRCVAERARIDVAMHARIDGEGRVRGFGIAGVPCRGGRRKERGKNERRAQKFELVMLSSCYWRATHARMSIDMTDS